MMTHPARPILWPLTVVLGLAAGACPSLAQTAGRFVLPPEKADITGSISPSVTGSTPPTFQFAAPQAGSSLSIALLRRFSADGRELRFETESSFRDMPIYVRPAQVEEQAKLRIRYMNSVAVMPEASKLTVFVNDHPIVETNIEASTEPAIIEAAIPTGVLEAGYNAVRIAVQQRHRVDCTIEAVNELWTQVDPSASGILFTTASDQISRLDDLLSGPIGPDGATSIIVTLPAGSDPTVIDRSIRAAQALAIRIGVRTPRIVFTREPVNTPGIHLTVGTTAELRSRGVESGQFGESAISVNGRAGGVIRVSIGGATPSDVDDSIDRLASEKPAQGEIGSTAGLRALAVQRGFPITSEGAVSLRDMGIASQEFSGRVFRTTFNVVLPADFYPADNGKATLFLDGGYVAGLASTNEALVRINGRVVGASRLSKTAGETLRRRPIEMSLKSLQPGFNTISLEIRTATDTDKDCNPLTLLESSNRLLVSDQTSFVVPRLARAAHLPNMSATANVGFPLGRSGQPTAVYLPKPDYPSLGAAATFLTRAAIAAGRPIPVRLTLTPPDERTGNALIVGAAPDVSAEIFSHFGIQKDILPSAWTKRALSARPGPSENVTAPAPARTSAGQPGRAQSGAQDQGQSTTFAPTQRGTRAPERNEGPAETAIPDTFMEQSLRALASFLQRNIGYSTDQLSFLMGGRAAFVVSRSARILLAQAESPHGRNVTWLLLAAPDAATLQKETVSLVSPSSWMQIAGRAIALDPAEYELNAWRTNSNYFFRVDDWSLGNVTLVAAGWLSNNIQYYVIVILAVCTVFGVVTRMVLNRIGSRP
jgi:hypothetical protein